VLLVGAGLLLNSFVRLIDVDPGYDPANVITAQINLPRTKYPGPAAQRAFFDATLDRLRQIPGVRAIGLTNLLPLTRGNIVLSFEPRPSPPGEEPPRAACIVSPGLRGAKSRARGAPPATRTAGTTPVVVVNRHWPDSFEGRRPAGT
jgi:hypothetical protein